MKNFYKDLENMIINEIKNGNRSKKNLYNILALNGYLGNIKSFNKWMSRIYKKNKFTYKESLINDLEFYFIDYLKIKKIVSFIEICDIFNCSPQKINKFIDKFRNEGYEISTDGNRIFLSTNSIKEVSEIKQIGTTEIIFGVASDIHFGSKACQITALNEFSEICKKKGIRHMFIPGDLVAGYNVYNGQEYDLYALSAQEQIATTIKNLPTGFNWYVLGGNHDYSFMTKGGLNILNYISSKRNDIYYVGFDDVNIPLLNNVELKMWHPRGCVPYSASYRLQKGIEQITYNELQSVVRGVKDKPSLRFVLSGHLHIQVQAMFGSIFGAQCGCFEGTTNYLKRLGLVPCIGGYIIKASLGKNGLLKNFDAKFYIFEEIENDWENYCHSLPEDLKLSPIFNK